ncbi:MAG: hypothetical protein V4525_07770 [Pseudomonadota bacterium]
MKILRVFNIFIVCLIGMGVTISYASDVKLSPNERIGLLVDVRNVPVHSHGAASLLARDTHREYPFDWKITNYLIDQFTKKVQASTQFQVVNLAEHGIVLTDVTRLIGRNDKTWVINPEKEAIIDRLQKDFNIRTLVVLSSSSDKIMINGCAPFPFFCRYTNGISTGLYTRRAMFGLEYFAVADIIADIPILDAPINLAYSDAMIKAQKTMIKPLPAFKKPVNIKAISEEEWQPVRLAVEQSIDNYIDAVIKELVQVTFKSQ